VNLLGRIDWGWWWKFKPDSRRNPVLAKRTFYKEGVPLDSPNSRCYWSSAKLTQLSGAHQRAARRSRSRTGCRGAARTRRWERQEELRRDVHHAGAVARPSRCACRPLRRADRAPTPGAGAARSSAASTFCNGATPAPRQTKQPPSSSGSGRHAKQGMSQLMSSPRTSTSCSSTRQPRSEERGG
jgi:hypothetical protein